MAKSYNKRICDSRDNYDDQERPKSKKFKVDRYKEKRVHAALRSRDIDALTQYEEDY